MVRTTCRSRLIVDHKLLRCIALVLALPIGCARDPAAEWVPVTGEVLLDGEPLDEGQIIFDNQLGISLSAVIKQGKFEFKSYQGAGLPPGKYQVAVKPQFQSDISPDDFLVGTSPPQLPPSPIPARYYDYGASGLSAQVAADAEPLVFNLQN